MSSVSEVLSELCPDGVNFVTVGDAASLYGGLTGKTKKDFGRGEGLYVPYMNVFSNPELRLDDLESVAVGAGERQNEIQRGDVLFTSSSERADEVGMSSVVVGEPSSPTFLNSFCFGIRFSEQVLEPIFAKHLFRSAPVRAQIVRTANGVTRYNISKSSFKKVRIPIPPLAVQAAVAPSLEKMEGLIAELEAELKLRQLQLHHYRRELLAAAEESRTVGESFMVLSTPRGVLRSQYGDGSVYPIVDQGRSRVCGYTDDAALVVDREDVVVFGDHTRAVKWPGAPFAVGADGVKVLDAVDGLDPRFGFHALAALTIPSRGYNRHWSVLREMLIPRPPVAEQRRIAAALDLCDALINDPSIGLPAEIAARRRQYEYYRDLLLAFPEKTA